MAYTSPFQAGVPLDDSAVQNVVNRIYNGLKSRELPNDGKPTFSEGDPVDHTVINTVISKCSGVINYSSNILPTIRAGTQITAYDMQCIEQCGEDLVDWRSCRSGCVGDCWKTCSTAGCINNNCSGTCASGCGNYCTGCSGTVAWGCVAKCGFDCAGTGSCKGKCSGSCMNTCDWDCLNECGGMCTNGCKRSCTSGCDKTSRIGTIANR